MKILISILLISSLGFMPNEVDIPNNETAPEGCFIRNADGRFYFVGKITSNDVTLSLGAQCWDCCPKEMPISGTMAQDGEPVRFELRNDDEGNSIIWDLDRQKAIVTVHNSAVSKITVVRTFTTTSFKKQEQDGKTYIISSDGEKIQLSESGKKKLKDTKEVEAVELNKKKN